MAAITVYSKPACVQCKAVKRYLDKNNVEYTTIDISQDDQAREYVMGLGYSQAPVVDMGNGVVFSGYRPDVIKKSLETVAA